MARRTSDKQPATGPSQRQLRVGEELRHALVEVLSRARFRDPDLQNASITVTEVRTSPDLKHATAFVLPLGGSGVDIVVKALNRAAAYLRCEVARLVQLRYAPVLKFAADRSFDHASRIDAALRRPDVQRDLVGRQDDDDPAER